MTHFLCSLPVYTLVRRRPPSRGSVLMISNDEQFCVHLFTDADLYERYLQGMGLQTTYTAVPLSTRQQVRQFLEGAPAAVEKVVLDAVASGGTCQRGILADIDQVLAALGQPHDFNAPVR